MSSNLTPSATSEVQRKRLEPKSGITDTVAAILNELKNAFVDWRYVYEKPDSGAVKIQQMLFVAEVLHETIRATGKADFVH